MPKLDSQVSVLSCCRCGKMVRPADAIITNENEHHVTWRCPECGGVCDSFVLAKKKPKSKKMSNKREWIHRPLKGS